MKTPQVCLAWPEMKGRDHPRQRERVRRAGAPVMSPFSQGAPTGACQAESLRCCPMAGRGGRSPPHRPLTLTERPRGHSVPRARALWIRGSLRKNETQEPLLVYLDNWVFYSFFYKGSFTLKEKKSC